MEALDRARAVNARLALPRLERMLRVYRTWVNVEGVEGGMALTRRELQCVLEFPELDHHVDFLFDMFRCISANWKVVPKVDLVTLLTTAAILAQGALADKARFVFQLVDLDTEDDIVEAELALVVSTCCNGLYKLGLIEEGDNPSELDAMAIAYEAFDFVELEDGDKMTFTMFLKWCVFHPRPKELLGRMSCLFSMCDCVRSIQDALEERSKRLVTTDTFLYYNDMHFGSMDEHAESVHVVAGPIVGKVESTRVNLILEIDTLATIKCFAFALPQEDASMDMGFSVATQECELRAFSPALLSVVGLSPGTMYVVRFLGVCKADRDRCVAVVTTKPREYTSDSNNESVPALNWRIRLLNHLPPVGKYRGSLRASEASAYQKIARDGYQSTRATLTVHFGFFLSPVKVSAMLEILASKNTRHEDVDEQVLRIIRQEYRRVLGESVMWTLLRTHSNWIMDDNASLLFGGFPEWRNARRTTWSVAETHLMRLALPVWQSYVECLWSNTQNTVRCLELGSGIIFAPITGRFDLQSEDREGALTKQISDLMREFPSPSAILLGTESPLFSHDASRQTNYGNGGYAPCLTLVQELLTYQKCQVLLLSFDDAGGYQSLISFKNTTMSIQQLVCGPVIGIDSGINDQDKDNLRPQTHQTDHQIVHHGALKGHPQYAQITSLEGLRGEQKAEIGGRKTPEEADSPYTIFQAQLLPLQHQREVHRVLGPIVGCVSSRTARILLEGDADGEVTCVVVDRLTLKELRVVKRIEPYQPTIFYITELTPGRTYDLSFQGLLNAEPGIFQTPHEDLPAFRLVIVAEDRFLDGRTDKSTSSDGAPTESAISYIGNVADYFFPADSAFQANVTVHIGSVVALAHDLQQTYHLLAQSQHKRWGLQLSNTVKECVRHHWNSPKNRELLARGAHWLPSTGVLRALLTANDVPISFIRAVQNILTEYEQVGDQRSHSVSPSRRYLYRLQDTVAVLMIDSLEVILDNEKWTPFVQLPETLLSDSQWSALEFWLTSDCSIHSQIDQIDIKTVVIMCDTPLISHQSAELTRMWRQNSRGKPDTNDASISMAGIGALSWGSYPKDQARLLHLIFRKLQKNSQFHVVFVCCGAFSSHDTIIEKSTKLSFQHVMVGPISRSGVSQWQDPSANNEPTFGDEDLSIRYSIRQEVPLGTQNSQQYCALELMAHPLRASSDVKFYTQHHDEARLIIGPIIGRVTPRTARILIEIDRPVPNVSCTLIDPATLQRHSTQMKVEAFTPTIVKVEGLQPGTRYAIKFEGLMGIKDAVQSYVVTPARVTLALDWLVVNCNSMASFLDHQPTDSQGQRSPSSSQWPRILAKGMPSFTAQLAGDSSYHNGDFLGDHDDEGQPNYNPWHSIEDEYLSEPLASPQLLLHLGGQVDMSRAFTNEELGSLVVRLAALLEAPEFDEDSERFQLLRSNLRYRLQEVYRVAWGIPPMKKLLGYCSSLMLLNEDTDLYFNRSDIRSILSKRENERIPDNVLDKVVFTLREIAFELWQLYQNQLWTDLAERELKYGSKSSGNKTAFSATFGINRMIVANVSHEVYEYCKVAEGEAQQSASSSGAVKRSLDEPSTAPTISLYSAPSWKIIDEACETSNSSSAVEHRTAPTKPQNPVQQLVFVTSGDLMAWGGSKHYPALRSEIVKLLEKLFAWKFVNRVQREVAVICVRTNGSSITFEITDEKISEKLTLTCVGSISDARELLHRDQKKTKGGAPTITKGVVIAKGNFSKRFSYRAITSTASITSTANSTVPGREKQVAEDNDSVSRIPTRCRTFVSYRFITDYRRGFFDETLRFFPPRVALPKAVLGPVIGRMIIKEAPRQEPEETLVEGDPGDPVKMLFTVPILLETNADARVVCIVTDILANQDIRVMCILTRHHPHVFVIPSLIPERRYVYRFEGIANSEDRRGSFHTPSSSSSPLTFVAVSSNFPEQMEESTDSLWMALNRRVQASWCGLDLILHLGGQVPMHEAAFECFEWIRRELRLHDQSEDDYDEAYIASLRRKVRQRLQQRYHLCWNVPNVRETLAHTSNWFLRSQADVAPFFRNHEVLATKAAQIVLGEAKQIVADYQLSLMLHDGTTASEEIAPEDINDQAQSHHPEQHEGSQKHSGSGETTPEQVMADINPGTGNHDSEPPPENVVKRSDTAQFIQTGEIGIFMCDMRDTPQDGIVTCNNRLLTPLTQQEHAVIGEKQWQDLEKALKKKATMVFVLCMELPLILTDAKQVDALQEEEAFSGVNSAHEEETGRWRLYDRQTISQHWVSCRRQLEQLLNLLFRWKAKHRGRDAIVLSGGMRVGLETLLQDRDTKLAIRNLTVGPLTARVEPNFENLPLDGIACPTFLGGARDDRFTFAHSVISNKNYLLAHAVVTREQTEKNEERGKVGGEIKSASIKTEFIAADGNVDVTHPISQYQRFPSWWPEYVPMGKMVFWDDTVIMRAQSDEDMSTLAGYLQDGRDFTAALEVLFEKHQFAEAARMEELRSKHRRRQRGPEELRLSLRAVFAELWKVLPEQLRQRLAYFQDEFVFDFLLGYLAPDLFTDDQALDEDVERPPLEFAAFSTLCRDFIFNAGVLNLCLNMKQEDEYHTIALQRADARRQAAERETQRIEHERQRAEEEAELARLQQENPEEYSKRKLAEQEIAQKEKLAKAEAARELRKAEKMHDVEEELAIAKEQRKLDKLAESGNDPVEFNRRRELVAARIRKFEERKRHREAEEARRRDKKDKKKKEQAL